MPLFFLAKIRTKKAMPTKASLFPVIPHMKVANLHLYYTIQHEKSDADQSAAFPGELSLKGSLTCDSIISHSVKK